MSATQLVEIAGGLGLFLIGMVLMTEGLRGVAGESLQRVLRRFTRSPVSGAVTGTLVTAAVQSSSATTLSAVGFAGAGLLSFPQALGIVFGANAGTTLTGWLVLAFGFKVEIAAALPLVLLIGVLMRLFGGGRIARAGVALAGFALLFLGIDALRTGMGGLEGVLSLEQLPADTAMGRFWLVGIGIALTLITQSSSAGVAMALAALSAGALSFPQACALVIGMDVGTTATAALATLGASLPARRTGFAHVIFNLLTGIGAFLSLPVYVAALAHFAPGATDSQPELLLVVFHTLFNVAGVLAGVLLAVPFSRLVERLVPARLDPLTRRLDRALLGETELALRALAPTLVELDAAVRALLFDRLEQQPEDALGQRRALLLVALDQVQAYLARLSQTRDSAARGVAALHVIDQLRRLLERIRQADRVRTLGQDVELTDWRQRAAHQLNALARRQDGDLAPQSDLEAAEDALVVLASGLVERHAPFRDAIAARSASGELSTVDALARMDAYRWLERAVHHAWRASHHLVQLCSEVPEVPGVEPPEPD